MLTIWTWTCAYIDRMYLNKQYPSPASPAATAPPPPHSYAWGPDFNTDY